MDAQRIQAHFVAVMAKHLPPSAASLRLIDLDGNSGELLLQLRADLDTSAIPAQQLGEDPIAANSVDAIVGYDIGLTNALLSNSLDALRPGGRFIAVLSRAAVSEIYPRLLSTHGYVRILVEPALDELGVLIRGEKAHETADTVQRIQSVAGAESDSLALPDFRGRYLHLLIQQEPNKPVWKYERGEEIKWRAAALQRHDGHVLLVFSSLPKAVAFLQPAVIDGLIRDINKVGKFSRATSQTWQSPVMINPTLDAIRGNSLTYIDIDPRTAEAPDE